MIRRQLLIGAFLGLSAATKSKEKCPVCDEVIKKGDILLLIAGDTKDSKLQVVYAHRGCVLERKTAKHFKKL